MWTNFCVFLTDAVGLKLRAHTTALVIPHTLGMVLNAKVRLLSYKPFNSLVLELTCCFSGGHCRLTQIQILLN